MVTEKAKVLDRMIQERKTKGLLAFRRASH